MEVQDYPRIEVEKLKVHPENPKIHTPEQLREIADSIEGNGEGRAIIISSDYYILAGEGQYLASMNLLKMKTVPYKFLEPKRRHNEPEAISYMLADNRLGEKSDWDYTKLTDNFKALKEQGFDEKFTGFDQIDLQLFTEDIKMIDSNQGGEVEDTGAGVGANNVIKEFPVIDDKTLQTDYCCPKCGYEWSGKPK